MTPAEKWPHQFVNKFTSFVFQAQSQTQGKGQRDNSWSSPPGNLYMTLLTEIEPALAPFVSIIACSAIMRTISHQLPHLKVNCKWVNDIFIDNSKVGGLLTTCSVSGQKWLASIGIGLNISLAPLSEATHLQKYTEAKLQVDDFARLLVRNILPGLANKQ